MYFFSPLGYKDWTWKMLETRVPNAKNKIFHLLTEESYFG